ncbi:Protein of unknown function [Gryllus bimaculatus]|nr:Protein of unknown function [Gryllus bimaculatus]
MKFVVLLRKNVEVLAFLTKFIQQQKANKYLDTIYCVLCASLYR